MSSAVHVKFPQSSPSNTTTSSRFLLWLLVFVETYRLYLPIRSIRSIQILHYQQYLLDETNLALSLCPFTVFLSGTDFAVRQKFAKRHHITTIICMFYG